LKAPLIRKYGEIWYQELEQAIEQSLKEKPKKQPRKKAS
jgi:hypothetical protein